MEDCPSGINREGIGYKISYKEHAQTAICMNVIWSKVDIQIVFHVRFC